jgi:hypothetical protein
MKTKIFKFMIAVAVASTALLSANFAKAEAGDDSSGDMVIGGTTYHCPKGSTTLCVQVDCTDYMKASTAN